MGSGTNHSYGCRAAIYHFTNKGKHRPKTYRDQLRSLEEFAASAGYETADIFCDMSLKRHERTEFDRFLSCCDQYDALIAKDYYHIAENTGKCISIMQSLANRGLKIYTLSDGIFCWEDPPLEKPLRVATYTCYYGIQNEAKNVIAVKNDIFKLFARKETSWILTDQYFDKSLHQRDGEQIQLMKLLDNKGRYDLLLVHNLNDIHWRTANFCKIRDRLDTDIYSLREGFLKRSVK